MTRKKLLMLLGSVCLALMMIAMACAGPAPSPTPSPSPSPAPTPSPSPTPTPAPEEKVYEWRMQSYGSRATAEKTLEFGDRLEAMTGGRIKLTTYCAGELIPTIEIMRAVGDGTIEIGRGSASYYAELDIGKIECGLPMSWSNSDEATLFFGDPRWQELANEAYEELGIHYLYTVYEAPYNILTKEPVNSLDDLKRMKLRATAAPGATFAKLGIASVYMPIEEVYLALSTGAVDGVLYGCSFEYKKLAFDEVAKYYLSTPMISPITGTYFINLDIWNALPDDLKAIVDECAYRQRFNHWDWVLGMEYATRDTFEVTTLSSTDVAKLLEAAMSVWDEEAAKSPRNAAAIALLKEVNTKLGRI